VFQIKDLTVDVLPGPGMLLGQNCRISADPQPGCDRSIRPRQDKPGPRKPETPDPECKVSGKLSDGCGHDHDRGPRRAAALQSLRRELRAAIAS
jgi:hypothetical protein